MNDEDDLQSGTKDGRRLVNIDQACAMTGVTRRTLYNWMNAKKIAFVRTAGGNIRIFADSLFLEGPRP